MASPTLTDLPIYKGKKLNSSDWDSLCRYIVDFITTNYDVTFGTTTANYFYGDVSNCTGFPSSDLILEAGEDISIGDIIREQDGAFYKATNASDAGITNILGVALSTVSTGESVAARKGLVVDTITGLTPNVTYYVGTNGGITTTKPSLRAVPIGLAVSTNRILINWTFSESTPTFPSFFSSGSISSSAAGNIGAISTTDSNSTGATISLTPAFSGLGTPAIQVSTDHPLLFVTNNTEKMRLTTQGNLGIGTNAPNATLCLGTETPVLSFYEDDPIYSLRRVGTTMVLNSAGGTWVTAGDGTVVEARTGNIAFKTGSESATFERLTIFENGNVGVGTTSPTDTFQIGDGTITNDYFFRVYTSSTDIKIGQSQNAILGFSPNSVALIVQDSTRSFPLAIGTLANADLILAANNAERVRIKTNGDFWVATNKFTVAASTGNTTVAGDFAVATNKFTVASATGNTLVAGTLSATGDFAVATNKFTVASATGNTLVAGTLSATGDFAVATNKFTVASATGDTLVAGTLSATGNFAVATNKFTVASATGNTLVAGTLRATGDFAVNTNKFNVVSSTGNTTVAGTLGVGDPSGNGTLNIGGSSITNILSTALYTANDFKFDGTLIANGSCLISGEVEFGKLSVTSTPGTLVNPAGIISSNYTDLYMFGIETSIVTDGPARTVSRLNYTNLINPSGFGLVVTDACVFSFDANAGTHKAIDSGTTKTTPGTVNAWMKMNVNGTIYYMPMYTSKTS